MNWIYFIYALYTCHIRIIDTTVTNFLLDYNLAYYNLEATCTFAIEGTPQFSAPSWVFLLWGLSVDLWIFVFIRYLLKQKHSNTLDFKQ